MRLSPVVWAAVLFDHPSVPASLHPNLAPSIFGLYNFLCSNRHTSDEAWIHSISAENTKSIASKCLFSFGIRSQTTCTWFLLCGKQANKHANKPLQISMHRCATNHSVYSNDLFSFGWPRYNFQSSLSTAIRNARTKWRRKKHTRWNWHIEWDVTPRHQIIHTGKWRCVDTNTCNVFFLVYSFCI